MKNFVHEFLALLFLVASLCSAQAQQHSATLRDIGYMPAGIHLLHAHADGSSHILTIDPSQAARIIEDTTTIEQVQIAADQYLADIKRPVLGLPSSATIIRHTTALIGKLWHSSYTVSYNSIPIVDRKASLLIGALSGKPMLIETNLPRTEPNAIEASLSAQSAASSMKDYAEKNFTVTAVMTSPVQLIYTVGGETGQLRLAYEGLVKDLSGVHLWRMRIDAISGEVLDVHDMFEYIGGHDEPLASTNGTLTALVHPQSQYDSVTSVLMAYENITINGQVITTDSLGRWSIDGVSAPFTIASTFLGPFDRAIRKDGANGRLQFTSNSPAPIILQWNDANSAPAERDAYYHIGVARQYVRHLDPNLTNLDAMLAVNVNLNQICNAYYDPTSVSVNFFKAGGNCTNTGEIADVVFHEFGHRVTDSRYTQHGGLNIVDGSLGEGFADLVSSFMRDDPRIGIGFFQKGSILRTCDNTKKWPKDLNPDIHISGEIISGAIWDLRKLIGRDTAEHLFHMMGYLNPDGIGSTAPGPMLDAFSSVLTAIIATDDDDNNLTNGTPHLAQILKAFNLHNIGLSGFLSLSVDQIADQDSLVVGYPVTANVKYGGKVGTLDAASVLVHYSVDGGTTFQTAPLALQGGNMFTGLIPKVRPGSIVHYYVSARTNFADAGEGDSPTAIFLVGFRRISLDDAEQDRGWSLAQPSDNATTGLWTRDIPYGTYLNLPDFVQQDTDHTANGSYCYLTGNANKAIASRDIGYDDVDNGSTTLTTPMLDLSTFANPVIKYWYYYRNDAGSNPGLPKWVTMISNNGGTSWKFVQNTNEIAMGWTAFIVQVSSFVVPSDKVMLRFIATDNVGAIVEAGIDDLEVLEGPKSEFQGVSWNQQASSATMGSVHPNPIASGTQVSIPFSLVKSEHVVIVVKDLLGRIVATPVDQFLRSGSYDVPYKVTSLPAGTYWVQMMTSDQMRFSRFVVTH